VGNSRRRDARNARLRAEKGEEMSVEQNEFENNRRERVYALLGRLNIQYEIE
jgi:hypothetical protein